MKNMKEIKEIVTNMNDEVFERIINAENDYWELDKRVSNNGYKRLVYNLKKNNLTVNEWFAWCAD